MSQIPIVDLGRVSELKSEIGEDDFSEVYALFLDEITAQIEELANIQCPRQAGSLLHSIKGSALNVGLLRLAHQAAAKEKIAEKGQYSRSTAAQLSKMLDRQDLR